MAERLSQTLRTCVHTSRKSCSVRAFSTSSVRRKQILPTFPPTSSPELDALLSTFRSNVFLPNHLARAQRNLIYRPSLQHHLLGDEPFTVELPTKSHENSTETFTLVPLNRLKDEPKTRQSLRTILDLMKERSDWDILPLFLAGLKQSGRRLGPNLVERMVRKAAEHGRVGTILDCLRQVENTNLKLDKVGIGREFSWGTLQGALESGWDARELTKAMRMMDSMLAMAEEDRHNSTSRKSASSNPKNFPEILGVALALAATNAAKYQEQTDQDGKVKRYAGQLLAVSDNADLSINPDSWWDANQKLMFWSPVWYAIETSIPILGQESPEATRLSAALRSDIIPTTQRAVQIVRDSGPSDRVPRGLKLYGDLQLPL